MKTDIREKIKISFNISFGPKESEVIKRYNTCLNKKIKYCSDIYNWNKYDDHETQLRLFMAYEEYLFKKTLIQWRHNNSTELKLKKLKKDYENEIQSLNKTKIKEKYDRCLGNISFVCKCNNTVYIPHELQDSSLTKNVSPANLALLNYTNVPRLDEVIESHAEYEYNIYKKCYQLYDNQVWQEIKDKVSKIIICGYKYSFDCNCF